MALHKYAYYYYYYYLAAWAPLNVCFARCDACLGAAGKLSESASCAALHDTACTECGTPGLRVVIWRGTAPFRVGHAQWRRNEFESGGGVHVLHFGCAPALFWLYKSQIFVSAFVMGRAVQSVSCLLFFYSRCPVASHL